MSRPRIKPQDHLYENLLREGIAAARNQDTGLACKLLEMAANLDFGDARPWIWLSATTPDPLKQREYLECAAAAEPANVIARYALRLFSKYGKYPGPGAESDPAAPESPLSLDGNLDALQTRTFLCPVCRGGLNFSLDREGVVCPFCGFIRRVERCPYGASHPLETTPDKGELPAPQAIGLMEIDEEEAVYSINRWLGRDWFTAEDLTGNTGRLQLQPAYYPFWIFDGLVEIPWECEVNLGSSKDPIWVVAGESYLERSGDVLIPGLQSLTDEDLLGLAPFRLKGLVEFKPEYLAGWSSLAPDRSLPDACSMACKQTEAGILRTLSVRVEPGSPKRGFITRPATWRRINYKYALLPLWVGKFRLRGRMYRLLLNGQTGKISAEKRSMIYFHQAVSPRS